MKRSALSATFLTTVSALFFATPSFAAQAPAAAPPPVTEVIVTAQRRSEKLSKVPVSVVVLSRDTLAKAQIHSEQDLRSATPGLTVRASANSNQLNYSLRGQSQDAFSGTRPGVLPYFNEVQIGGNGATAFYDLASVQVLKGPQGTLFGRSATGGAVLFETAKPTNKFGGYISETYGNYDASTTEGAINVPLVRDQLMARVAGFHTQRDGFQHNLFNDATVGKVNRTAVRGSLTGDFSGVHNELVLDYFHSDGQSTVPVLSGLQPFTGGVQPPFIPIAFLYAGTATPTETATGIATLTGFLTPSVGAATAAAIAPPAYLAYFAPGTGHPADGISGFLASQKAAGPFVINSDAANVYKADNIIITDATTYELGADIKLKNIFGFTNLDSKQDFEADGTPYGISQTTRLGQPFFSKALTQQVSDELQLLGSAFNDKLTYVTGLYFSHDTLTIDQYEEFFDLVAKPFGLPAQTAIQNYTITNTTYAGYGQGTYKLNDHGLAATVGARYTSEKVGIVQLSDDSFVTANPVAPAGYSYDQATTFNKVSWQFGLQQQVNSNLLLYAVSRRAYKSGGYNGQVAPKVGFGDIAGNAYKAEQVTDVELGGKYQGHIADLPIRASVGLFNGWVDNSQRTAYTLVSGSPTAITVNVPAETIYGAEFEAQINPTPWLAIGGTANYIHAKYTNGTLLANGATDVFDQVPDTPEFSGTIFADVTMRISDNLDATIHGDVYDQSKSTTSPQSVNSAGTALGDYALANFRVGIEDKKAGWSLIASVKNAFNRVYYVGGEPTGNIYQINTLIPGDPQTYSLTARVNF